MAQMFETVAHIASIVASVMAVSAPAAAGLGFLPRAGPMRAVVLGVSSKWSVLRPSFTASQRAKDCEALKSAIAAQSSKQYVVVTGPKGVGKTTIVDTMTAQLPGVVRVNVSPGTSQEKIVGDALKAVARFQFSFVDPSVSGVTRVVNWHKRVFRTPPTVILRVRERGPGKEAASVGGAVRELVEDYRVHVIVDSSDSSLDQMALTTIRQRIVQVGPMERDVLESIPEFQDLLEALKKKDVADLVWGVVGGNPAHYDALNSDWVEMGRKNIVTVAETYVTNELLTATNTFNAFAASHPSLVRPVYDQFKTVDELPASIMKTIVFPTPDKVLRLVARKGQTKGVLVPTTPAMALVMRYGMGGDPPSLEVVRKAVGKK